MRETRDVPGRTEDEATPLPMPAERPGHMKFPRRW